MDCGLASRVRLAVLLSVADPSRHVDLHGMPAGWLQQLRNCSEQLVQASTSIKIAPTFLACLGIAGHQTALPCIAAGM